jgi:hypothetical protein
MRTSQRDQGGVVTFDAAVSDAPSGSGVGQPGGIPFRSRGSPPAPIA